MKKNQDFGPGFLLHLQLLNLIWETLWFIYLYPIPGMCHLIASRIKVIGYIIDVHEVLVNLHTLSQSSTNTLEYRRDGFITTDEEDVENLIDAYTC